MPYQDIKDLPDAVKNYLPKYAAEIFLATVNNALKEYNEEETAFKVAWAAVKRAYHKGEDGNWHKKPD
ncbi:MAG: ChaB family protein [Cyanomargarita calcarea GSE-NOS-MK-12-04C]|jgi:cation transport regulator|uniref:ChaB family protein n=1 Tax=Cyanomargarita calcarea GSE-NOS-MK-12-04C TaxID=2839659 RepID=A0A951QS21_9CYAN|nr:ChaB family protein [Cyanomargarita calcarea GSE-NOS-MK-12-04C]